MQQTRKLPTTEWEHLESHTKDQLSDARLPAAVVISVVSWYGEIIRIVDSNVINKSL